MEGVRPPLLGRKKNQAETPPYEAIFGLFIHVWGGRFESNHNRPIIKHINESTDKYRVTNQPVRYHLESSCDVYNKNSFQDFRSNHVIIYVYIYNMCVYHICVYTFGSFLGPSIHVTFSNSSGTSCSAKSTEGVAASTRGKGCKGSGLLILGWSGGWASWNLIRWRIKIFERYEDPGKSQSVYINANTCKHDANTQIHSLGRMTLKETNAAYVRECEVTWV